METVKLYHKNPFQSQCETKVMAIDPDKGVVLAESVAFAEAGGQLGDAGVLVIGNKEEVPFTDTQKGLGRVLILNDFPSIQVETATYHKVSSEDITKFSIGQKVIVKIDVERRALLTISHSGIHLVLMGIEKLYPGAYKLIKGCSIKPDGARLDFRMETKFSQTDASSVQDYVNNLIALKEEMFVFPHKNNAEAWYWQLNDYIIPCGGTHLKNTEPISEVIVKKESLGKSAQRMSFKFNNYKIPYDDYEVST